MVSWDTFHSTGFPYIWRSMKGVLCMKIVWNICVRCVYMSWNSPRCRYRLESMKKQHSAPSTECIDKQSIRRSEGSNDGAVSKATMYLMHQSPACWMTLHLVFSNLSLECRVADTKWEIFHPYYQMWHMSGIVVHDACVCMLYTLTNQTCDKW